MTTIDRRSFVQGVAIVLAAGPRVAAAQPGGRLPRVVIVHPGLSATSGPPMVNAILGGLADLGWHDGRNVVVEARFGEGKFETLPDLFTDIVRSAPSVMVVATTPGNLAARKATATIPIVLVAVGDPIAVGLVTNYARPGGNITGISNSTLELTAKRLQILKEALPRLGRVSVMGNPDDQNYDIQRRDAEAAARTLGLTLSFVDVRRAADLEPAVLAATRDGAQAVLRLVDPLRSGVIAPTMALLARHRLPGMFAFRDEAEAGGLLAYGPDLGAHYRDAAVFVDKILKGARPGDLPVERPTRFELTVNLRTAKAFGLALSPSLLLRADRVIQ